jgi:arsenate reductase
MTRRALPFHVLFLCTGNSARSIFAEAILARRGGARFAAHSAGSQPKGQIHPLALEVLAEQGHEASGLRSKSWNEFTGADALALDFVFTVCDSAAAEVCPVWPGQPITAHWGVTDPAAFDGPLSEQRWLFRRVYRELDRRIDIFTNLNLESLGRIALQRSVDAIGKLPPAC